MRQTLFILITVLTWPMMVSGNSGDEHQYQVATVLVQNEQFNVYGHWLSGQVEIVLDGDKVFANGWQVEPILRSPENHKNEEEPEETQMPWTDIENKYMSFYDEATSRGESREQAIAFAVNEVNKQPRFEAVRKEHSVVFYVDGKRVYSLTYLPEATIELLARKRYEKAANSFMTLLNRLSAGDLVIVSTSVLPCRVFFEGRPREVLKQVQEAQTMTEKISAENWENEHGITALMAEGIRNPLPESMRERR